MKKFGDGPDGQIERIRNLESCVRTLAEALGFFLVSADMPDEERLRQLTAISFVRSALED